MNILYLVSLITFQIQICKTVVLKIMIELILMREMNLLFCMLAIPKTNRSLALQTIIINKHLVQMKHQLMKNYTKVGILTNNCNKTIKVLIL